MKIEYDRSPCRTRESCVEGNREEYGDSYGVLHLPRPGEAEEAEVQRREWLERLSPELNWSFAGAKPQVSIFVGNSCRNVAQVCRLPIHRNLTYKSKGSFFPIENPNSSGSSYPKRPFRPRGDIQN